MDGPERQERRQRVRIGLTGLAFVFLLVLLGTAISRSGDDGRGPFANAVNMIDSDPDDPMAQIGAAPGASTSDNSVASSNLTTSPSTK